jgi:peptidoglycan/xylan/chitin deacetylase (PgdA/CDA1 family)
MLRRVAKRIIAELALRSGIATISRRANHDRILVLAYHNIVPTDEPAMGERTLHLSQKKFAEQLDAIGETHDVLPLSKAIEPQSRGRPGVVITFDDAYHGAMSAGVSELQRRGFGFTVFVAPGILGTWTWWDRLADPLDGTIPQSIREAALTACRGMADQVLARFGAGRGDLPESARIATAQELRVIARVPGVSIASHTWSHASLVALSPSQMEEELVRSRAWLADMPGSIPWLAYPYGRHNAAAEQSVREAGYEGAWRVSGGWMRRGQGQASRFALPRQNVAGSLETRMFRLMASGLVSG